MNSWWIFIIMINLRKNITKFNDWLADKLSYILSAMITFYIVGLLVLIPLVYTQPTSIVAWASYLCSVIFQGIALPVLGYTARKSGEKTDTAIAQILELSNKIEKVVELIEQQQLHMDKDIDDILDIETKDHKKD